MVENNHRYNYSFIDINNYEIYNKLSQIIDISVENIEHHQDYKDILKYINDNKNSYNNLELIYNIFVNKFIFDLQENPNANNNLSENAKSFLKWVEKREINLNNNSKKVITYLINKNLFDNKIIPKLKLPQNTFLNEDSFYTLLFGIKLVIIIQQIKDNIFSNFYTNRNNLIASLENSYIPGAFPPQNEQIDSYREIEDHLRNQPPNYGIYMCSCGKFYIINPCGYPAQISNCQKCGLQIGGTNHRLVERPGHFRIILDEQDSPQHLPYMLLSEYKRQKIDPLLNRPYKGIGKISKEIINKSGYNIRNINELSFRIMNYIIYSHLLVSNILDILNDFDMTNYFSEETSCFNIMLSNWNKIQELLNQMGVNNIQIFMNIIFGKIIQIISKYQINALNNQEGRDRIENEFNLFINWDDIRRKITTYEQKNRQILNSSPYNISSLIQQLYPVTFYKNKEQEPYPHFKYLFLYSLPQLNEVTNIIESNDNFKNKYPLTLKVLKHYESKNKNISLLGYLPKINKKLNHLIDNYSYKINRDEAAKKTIKEEFDKEENNIFVFNKIEQEGDIKNYMGDLFELFEKFKDTPLQWGCHPLPQMIIDSKSSLCTILLDDNEPGYYLASIYKKLIEYQNTFLDNIINLNSQNGLLHCFVKQLNSEIMVQDSTINEIVKLDIDKNEKNNLKLYSDLNEIIFVNTSNNPFTNKFNYELDQIELELGNIILPGIRKFKSTDDELRYITYMFEGYRGKNSNILTNFNEKYTPKELTQNEKNILHYFINNFTKDEYKNFLFSIQILINYIQNSGNPKETPIYQIIQNIPDHINVDENIKNLFITNKELTIDKLVRIFEFFEHLCWNQITDNLLDEFKKPLNKDKIKLIEDYYKNNNDVKNNIKKIELAGAIRKFISRYLAGKRSQSEIAEDKMLFDYLIRVDLWVRNIDEPKFEKEFFELSKFKITVGEGKYFYEKLGGDNELLNFFFKEEENINYNNEEENKKIIENEINEQNEIIVVDKKIEEEDEKAQKEKNEMSEKNYKNKFNRRKLF